MLFRSTITDKRRQQGVEFSAPLIENVRELLLQGKHASEDDLKAIDKEIKEIVNDSAEFAKDSPEPPLEELWTDIYAKADA